MLLVWKEESRYKELSHTQPWKWMFSSKFTFRMTGYQYFLFIFHSVSNGSRFLMDIFHQFRKLLFLLLAATLRKDSNFYYAEEKNWMQELKHELSSLRKQVDTNASNAPLAPPPTADSVPSTSSRSRASSLNSLDRVTVSYFVGIFFLHCILFRSSWLFTH